MHFFHTYVVFFYFKKKNMHRTPAERVLNLMNGGLHILNTDENVADLLTKPLSGPKRVRFVRMVLHHIFPEGD